MTASSGSYSQSPFNNPWSAFGIPIVDPTVFLKQYKAPILKSSDFTSAPFQPTVDNKSTVEFEQVKPDTSAFSNPVPDEDYNKILQRNAADYAFNQAMLRDYYDLTRQQNLASMQDMFPWQVAAADIATKRNLEASKNYRSYAEQLPTAQQNRAATRQSMMESAGLASARDLDAMSTAYARAAQGAGIRFHGNTFSVS